ncbi:MAG: hypothetical protein L6R35_007137, partial [Caloplaca aegaea]
QSPQLLELSGIGDPAVLSAAGIETRVANPNVGENLQDHMSTMMVYELDPSIITPEAIRSDPLLAAAADEQYETSKTGPRTAAGYAATYLPFSHYSTPEEISRLASLLSSTSPSSAGPEPAAQSDDTASTSRLRDQILSSRFSSASPGGQIEFVFDVSNYSPFFQSEPGKRYGTMMQMLQYPFSVGSIHIPASSSSSSSSQKERPTSSDDKPVINPRYYQGVGGHVDFLTMAAAQIFGHRICETRPLKDIIVKRVFPPLPPPLPNDKAAEEEENWEQWVRDTTITDWHPVGTCAMGGNEGIQGGVVDDRLRVYGVQGLRVCDASVMPLQIAAHLQATVYAIGEKGADMVREDWVERRRMMMKMG